MRDPKFTDDRDHERAMEPVRAEIEERWVERAADNAARQRYLKDQATAGCVRLYDVRCTY
jgi:hypothetical protein